MYVTLNYLFFNMKLDIKQIAHIPLDNDLEYDEQHEILFMNLFTPVNICEMTGILLAKMCLISSIDQDIHLEDELDRCGFIHLIDDDSLSKDRFYDDDEEYLSIYDINAKLVNNIKE